MRRALYLLAVVTTGAATAASAQARAITVARLDPKPRGAPGFAAHVSNLLDDPEWQERWGNAFFIQLHWKVQLWQENKVLFFSGSLPATEWDVCVRQVPGLDTYNYTELTSNGRTTTTFSTLDSLKAHLTKDVGLRQPQLSPGKWYYRIDVHVSTSEEDPCDPRSTHPGALTQFIQGNGPTRDLPPVNLTFKVP